MVLCPYIVHKTILMWKFFSMHQRTVLQSIFTLGVCKIFFFLIIIVFDRSLLIFTRLHLVDQKLSKNSNIVKNLKYNF